MAEVIIMPKLGFNMDEGELVIWHKKEGDTVKKGEVFFEINTDKTAMPVEATSDGVVLKTLLEEGDVADVFTPIAVVGQPGEDPDAALAAYAVANGLEAPAAPTPEEESTPASDVAASAPAGGMTVDVQDLKLTPRAKTYVKNEGIDLASLAGIKGTGFEGGITSRDIKASPLAKKIAEAAGIDLAQATGTGVQGKIMKEDVERLASAQAAAGPDPMMIEKEEKYKGVRRTIGEKLAASKFTAPHLYFTDEVDTTAMTAFRKQLNENSDVKIAVSDLLTMAACKALKKYPEINVSLQGDTIVYYKSINVGTAVAGDKGLMVPVIKNVQNKTLTDVAKESKDLVARAKEGKLDPTEYSGGTFSISNLGMFGIKNFTAIINAPEAAILSVSSVRKTPVVITDEVGEDKIVIRPMMNIQLSVDHRLIDGLLASQFVEYMKELLENPVRILM